MEVIGRTTGVSRRLLSQMLASAAFGLLAVVSIGVASADETPTSAPAVPDTSLAPAVVVAAGADSLDVNAVTRVTAFSLDGTRTGTAFGIDDGRIVTVAHALVAARSLGLGDRGVDATFHTIGSDGIEVIADRAHDLAAVSGTSPATAALSVADGPVEVGDGVAVAGVGRDARIRVVTGAVIARTSGRDYGIPNPDVYAIDVAVSTGWSGGPVVNGDGEVVAVIVGREQTSGIALAVPIDYLPAA